MQTEDERGAKRVVIQKAAKDKVPREQIGNRQKGMMLVRNPSVIWGRVEHMPSVSGSSTYSIISMWPGLECLLLTDGVWHWTSSSACFGFQSSFFLARKARWMGKEKRIIITIGVVSSY